MGIKKNEINRSILNSQPPYSHNLIISDYEVLITESDFICSVTKAFWLVGAVAMMTAIPSTKSWDQPVHFFFHQILFPGLRVSIFSSSLTWNLTLRWIASWFLQKCKKILNKIHYVCSQPQKKEAKFTNSDAYGHSNTKLLQKLRLYSTKRIFRYIYYVSSIQQCVVRKSSS